MKVVVTTERSEYGDYASLEIVIDDKTKFTVHHSDSPEDNTLDRNFSDCYDIPDLLAKAYQAGLDGAGFDIQYIEAEDEDY